MNVRVLWVFVFILCTGANSVFAQQSAADFPASAFASLNGYTAAELSPSGEQMAFLYPIDGRHNLIVHTFADSANAVIPPIEGLDFNWMEWANDDTLVFSMSLSTVRRGYVMAELEETRLLALNVVTREVTPLIKPAEVVGRTGSRVAKEYYGEPQLQDDVIDWLPDDPDHILVAVDEDWDARYEVRKVNVNNGNYRLQRKSLEGIQNWIVDQAGDIRLGYGYGNGEFRMYLKNTDGDWLALKKLDWYDNGWSPLVFSENPDVIIVTGTGDHGTREARLLDLRTGEFVDTLFSDPTYDVRGVIGRSRDRDFVGVSYTDHMPSINYFDEEFAKLQATIDRALPDTKNRIQSYSEDMRKLVIRSFNSREPGMLLIWDRDAKTMEPFGWYNEELDPELLADVEAIEFTSVDGTTIPAYLTVPPGAERTALPTVVLPHGGPTSRDDKSYWFLTQFLVSRGYAVLQPNFRGSRGYGEEFRDAGRGQWGGLMQEDVDAGARWLVEQGIADPDRMCIVGWSYGGYSAAIGLVNSPELYRCGVGINGVYNLPQQIADSNQFVGGTTWTRHIGLDGESTRSVSPHHQVERIQAPFLIIHAEDDHRVQIKQADGFYSELLDNDKDARLIKMDHGGHSMVTAAARERILLSIESFLQENIGAP